MSTGIMLLVAVVAAVFVGLGAFRSRGGLFKVICAALLAFIVFWVLWLLVMVFLAGPALKRM